MLDEILESCMMNDVIPVSSGEGEEMSSTAVQYNPNDALNAALKAKGLSKTVYALVTPETEAAKDSIFGDVGSPERAAFYAEFRDAWTNKQDAYHEDFFSDWVSWSAPVVEFDRKTFPFYYPTAGASEALRHIIYTHGLKADSAIHIFAGEYEGYKAMALAAGVRVYEHARTDFASVATSEDWCGGDLFFVSAPSAIDGNVWSDLNAFLAKMPSASVVLDLTYVGAVPERAVTQRIDARHEAVHSVVFSLSKPFGVYYDRVGGVWMREEDAGLFGNKWFKSLPALRLGRTLMETYGVFDYPERYAALQQDRTRAAAEFLKVDLAPADVYILASAPGGGENEMSRYLERGGTVRVCLTPGMADRIGTTGAISC